MSDKKTAESSKKTPEPAVVSAPAEPRFTVPELREHSKDVLGVEESTFDGAFYGASGTFTKDEAAARLQKWLSRPLPLGRKGAK